MKQGEKRGGPKRRQYKKVVFSFRYGKMPSPEMNSMNRNYSEVKVPSRIMLEAKETILELLI